MDIFGGSIQEKGEYPDQHTYSYPERLKSFCKSSTADRHMKILYTARSNNSQDNWYFHQS